MFATIENVAIFQYWEQIMLRFPEVRVNQADPIELPFIDCYQGTVVAS